MINDTDIQIDKITKVIESAPILSLEIITSTNEPRGVTLEITPLGMTKGIRQIKDGYSFFGYETDDNKDKVNLII